MKYGDMVWGVTRNGERFGAQQVQRDDGTPLVVKLVEEEAMMAVLDHYGQCRVVASASIVVPGQTVGSLEWLAAMQHAPAPMTDTEQWAWVDHQQAALDAGRAYLADPTPALLEAAQAARAQLWEYSASIGWPMFADPAATQFKPKAVPKAAPVEVAPKTKATKKKRRAA